VTVPFHSDLSDGQKLTEKSPNVFKIHLLHNMAVVEILSLNREGNIEGCIMNDANDEQEAQLSHRYYATLRVIEYFAKSLKITQGHSK